MLKPVTFTAPAHWASALINGDWTGLEDAEAFELREYLKANPEHGQPVSCTDYPELGLFSFWCSGPMLCELLEYTYLVNE